jgi:hypothetical protein
MRFCPLTPIFTGESQRGVDPFTVLVADVSAREIPAYPVAQQFGGEESRTPVSYAYVHYDPGKALCERIQRE